jgi:glutaminyl-tRNA synthetase
MPTLVGARRRGFTPDGFRLLIERTGVSKNDTWLDMSLLESAMRDDLNEVAERRVAILDPLKLIIDNYPEGQSEECFAPNHPQKPELGKRSLPFSRELWIERDDFMETPPKAYFRLSPGKEVRLRYGYIVQCTGVDKDAAGNITAVHATYDPDTKSGTPGAETRKVKGNIHWLSATHAKTAEIRLYDRLFSVPFPGARNPMGGSADVSPAEFPSNEEERNYLDDLNPNSKKIITGYIEPALTVAAPETRFQFERQGYFVADLTDHTKEKPVFNRTVTLKDSWGAGIRD